ncbi:MAG: Uncharacterised protein [Bacteroidota bacterium]|nr:MAG: Uncharacterised protein [Bacteroidota bacterium]
MYPKAKHFVWSFVFFIILALRIVPPNLFLLQMKNLQLLYSLFVQLLIVKTTFVFDSLPYTLLKCNTLKQAHLCT